MLTPGTRLGVYEIVALLGVGGMGEVYRAIDTDLKRQVAIKVLPDSVARDAARLARFQREAEVLAALNHPNIAHIFGLERSAGTNALVIELVEGPTLADRIAQGPIPLAEAIPLAKQLAAGIEAAHEVGIIHRDLKPANIKVRPDGTIKILDFGLAKAIDASAGATMNSELPPTISMHATELGVILGTAAYMSPEQARGQSVTKRTDIWAFGCVLQEMLSGRAPFARATASDTIAAILERDPDWGALPDTVPPRIRRLLRKCLEKDFRQRLRDIGDAAMEFDEPPSEPTGRTAASRTRGPSRLRLAAAGIAGVALFAIGAAAALFWSRGREVSHDAVRLSLPTPGQFFAQPPSAAISPDGRNVAFISSDASGKDMLWIQILDRREPRMLAGTERADLPFWSPDSRSIGFFADGKLKKVDAGGGPVQTVTAAGVSPGATWNPDGVILFASGALGRLATVAAAGGSAAPLNISGAWPHFLPDGRHFLYFESGPDAGVYVGTLDSKETRLLLKNQFEASFAPPGYLLFVREENLYAQALDLDRLQLTGEPRLVAEGVWAAPGYGHSVFSAGASGALAYVNAAIADTQLAWFDRSGRPLGLKSEPGRYDFLPQISPDGRKVVVARGPLFGQDLWVFDAASALGTRLTFAPSGNRVPVWSPDGSRILFQSTRGDGTARLYQKNTNGAGLDERIADTPNVNLQDVSPDGRFVVYMLNGPSKHFELWVMPLSGDRRPYPFLQAGFNNSQAQVSPDGHWIAYTSNESGRDEIYVQSFPLPGSKRQVSSDGGAQPRWRKHGGELYYLAPDQFLMSVPVKTGARLEAERPRPLFQTRLDFAGTQGPFFMASYDASADGQNFILNVPPDAPTVPITVIVNWAAALRQ